MSKIITPLDVITITIDNMSVPPKAEMKLSRDMPGPYVILLLCQLATQTASTMINQMNSGAFMRPPQQGGDNGKT
jgi:hypothetical protein